MLFKIMLVILLIAMIVSLSGALKSLYKDDSESGTSSKTFKWLAIRVSIAVAIIVVASIGYFTGELTIGAPWSGRY